MRTVTLLAMVAACGTPAKPAPAKRAERACAAPLALPAPGKRDNVRGVRAGVVCEDGACELTVSAGGPTRGFPLADAGHESLVGVRRADVDGDGADELIVLATLIQHYGPDESSMEIISRALTVIDAQSLALRWHTDAWGSTPPEEHAIACASEAELRDQDCDGRREALVQVRRCDPPMCADVRAGKPPDDEFVRDECGAREPLEERLAFHAATAGGAFTAIELDE